MRAGVRSAATMGVLFVLLLVGAWWGWSSVTAPFPGKADPALCEDQVVHKGDKVFPEQVVVSVLNAGSREGLAGRTMQLLVARGFREGESANAPHGTEVAVGQIWTEEPDNPAVRLLQARLGPGIHVIRREAPAVGVTLVVGDAFHGPVPGPKSVTARSEAEICSPPLA
jgi:hypothetical protein